MYLGNSYYSGETKFDTLNLEQMKDLHSASCRILEDVGMVVHHDEVIELLRNAGATIEDGNKAFIPTSLVEWAIKSAPSRVTLYDRNSKPAMHLENRNVYFGTGSDTYNLINEKNERRRWKKKDVENGIILCDYLDNIDFVMTMGVISDVDIRMNTREQYALMFKNTTKPMVVVCEDANDLNDIIDMAAAVRGGREFLKKKPYFVLYCEPTTPLVNSFTALDKLLIGAENSIPTTYATGGMAGATTPMTVGGTIALSNAECLFGMVIHQLKNPGAPFMYGYGNAPLDMKTMQSAYATPLAVQIQGGMCDMARFYQVPCWGEAGNGCSKACDTQAVMESAHFILMSALQGCNLTHDCGYLDFGLSCSFELLVMCDEMISRTKDIVKNVQTNEEFLGLDAIVRVGHGGNYLGDEHTFNHLHDNERGDICDYLLHDEWVKKDSLTMEQRAHQKVKQILSSYKPEPLHEELAIKIDNIINEAKEKLQKE